MSLRRLLSADDPTTTLKYLQKWAKNLQFLCLYRLSNGSKMKKIVRKCLVNSNFKVSLIPVFFSTPLVMIKTDLRISSIWINLMICLLLPSYWQKHPTNFLLSFCLKTKILTPVNLLWKFRPRATFSKQIFNTLPPFFNTLFQPKVRLIFQRNSSRLTDETFIWRVGQ